MRKLTMLLFSLLAFVGVVRAENVAKIGDVEYETLQEAVNAVQEGETIILIDNVNVTTPAYGQNALNHAKAVSFTLDLNGKTLSANTGNSVFRFNIANSGATSDVTLTIKNGTIVAGSNTWCAVMVSGISSDVKAIMNLENLTIESSKANDMAVKSWANATINAEKVTVNTTNAAGGFYAVGGEIVLDECTVNQKGLYTSPYMSMAFAVSSNGKITINSGTYSAEPTAAAEGSNQGSTHGSWVGGVMNSGGELIINGGTFSNGNFGDDALATYARGLIFADSNGKVTVNGGTFNALKSIFDFQNNLGKNPPVITVKGGNYSADPATVTSYGSIVLDANCVVVENNGVWNVVKAAAKIGEKAYATLEDAFKAATSGCTIDLKKDITVAKSISINKLVTIDLNGKAISSAEGYVFEVTGGELVLQGGGSIGAICYIINDADYKAPGKTFALTGNKNDVDIVYNRRFGHTSWQVLYVPFAIPVEKMEGFEVYSISNVTDSGVVIEPVVEGDLSANTPYIIKATEAGDKTIKVTGATLSVPDAYTAKYDNFTINGTYSSMAIDAESQYVLTNGLWCQLTEKAVTDGNNILGAFRVYLTANGENTPSEVRFVINNSDATAIDELKAENVNVKAEVYDLSGRRVEKAVKGIYVVNGVKVIK